MSRLVYDKDYFDCIVIICNQFMFCSSFYYQRYHLKIRFYNSKFLILKLFLMLNLFSRSHDSVNGSRPNVTVDPTGTNNVQYCGFSKTGHTVVG